MFPRRWLAVAAAALSTAAVLLAAVWLETTAGRPTRPRPCWTRRQNSSAASRRARDNRRGSPPDDYPISREILRTPQVRWRPIRGLLGCTGVAYDLSAPGGRRATLYVVSRPCPDSHPPPLEPRPTTAGCSAAAWQEDGLLYVLVVEGARGLPELFAASQRPA